jgi:hypothetical protein
MSNNRMHGINNSFLHELPFLKAAGKWTNALSPDSRRMYIMQVILRLAGFQHNNGADWLI